MVLPAAIVLAGGGSRRMGGDAAAVDGGDTAAVDKLSLDVAGVPMLDRVLAAVRPLCGRLVVVGPARATAVTGVRFVQEPAPGGGPVPAVAAGLAAVAGDPAATTGVVLVLAADLPLLATADLRLLLDRLAADPEVDAVAAVDHRGRPNPLLAAYRTSAVAGLRESAGAPAAGLLPVRLATVDLGPGATLNVNRPADLEAAVAVLRSRGRPPSTRSSSPP